MRGSLARGWAIPAATDIAFDDPARVEEAKLGILAGSLLSALAGFLVLRLALPHPRHQEEEGRQAGEIAADGDVESLEEGKS